MKEIIRQILFPIALLCGGEFAAKQGSLWCRFLTWLYGEGDVQHDGWMYPEDIDDAR